MEVGDVGLVVLSMEKREEEEGGDEGEDEDMAGKVAVCDLLLVVAS